MNEAGDGAVRNSSRDGKALAEQLRGSLAELLADWTAAAADEPWLSLPEQHRLDSIPDVALATIDAAFGTMHRSELTQSLIHAGVEHGRHRREMMYDVEVLFREYYFLREAFWRRLSTTLGPSGAAQAIVDIDHALTVVQRASAYGYHRRELEAAGRWQTSLDSLAKEISRVHDD